MATLIEDRSPIEIAAPFLSSAPVDLEGLAQALGIAVVRDSWMESEVAGKIERQGSGYRITVNGSENARRQRFTLAHELAHYILHRDLIGDGITDSVMYRSSMSDDIERQANRFAADLLMPAGLVRQKFRSFSRAIAELAAVFDVSTEAMRIRMKDLRLGA